MKNDGAVEAVFRDARRVICPSCDRVTVTKRSDDLCKSCREAPKDNWWSRVYANIKEPPPPQKITCRKCDRTYFGPRKTPGGEVTACERCLRCPAPDPPSTGTAESTAACTGLKTIVKANCVNAVGNTCIMREGVGCIVLLGRRCGYFEKAVIGRLQPDERAKVARQYAIGETVSALAGGRECPDCSGPLPKFKRRCPACAKRHRRESDRRRKREKRG